MVPGPLLLALVAVMAASTGSADEFLPAEPVELQPLLSATGRLVEALDVVGAPLSPADRATLAEAGRDGEAIEDRSRPTKLTHVVLNSAEVKKLFFNAGVETVGSTPEVLGRLVKEESVRIGKVIREAGIRAD